MALWLKVTFSASLTLNKVTTEKLQLLNVVSVHFGLLPNYLRKMVTFISLGTINCFTSCSNYTRRDSSSVLDSSLAFSFSRAW